MPASLANLRCNESPARAESRPGDQVKFPVIPLGKATQAQSLVLRPTQRAQWLWPGPSPWATGCWAEGEPPLQKWHQGFGFFQMEAPQRRLKAARLTGLDQFRILYTLRQSTGSVLTCFSVWKVAMSPSWDCCEKGTERQWQCFC